MDLSKFQLKGKKVLVSGGNTGIGLGIALGLSRAGAIVAITGRNQDKTQKALNKLRKLNDKCQSFCFDFNDIYAIPSFYNDVSTTMNGLDVLVNNAGMQCRGRADKIALEDFERTLKVNLIAPYALSQCFAREHIENKSPASIIMIASLMSEAARPSTSPYTASKGGIRQLVKALAVDWAKFRIRVNGIGPGYVKTGMTQVLVNNQEFDSWVKKRTPLTRWGKPDDFEGVSVFLASDASSFITGQIIYVDGGWLATF